MSNRIQFSNGVEISKGSEIRRKQRMLSYAKNSKEITGIESGGKSNQQVQTVAHTFN